MHINPLTLTVPKYAALVLDCETQRELVALCAHQGFAVPQPKLSLAWRGIEPSDAVIYKLAAVFFPDSQPPQDGMDRMRVLIANTRRRVDMRPHWMAT